MTLEEIRSRITGSEKEIGRILSRGTANVPYADLYNLSVEIFGEPRKKGSHRIFSTTLPGPPFNLQEEGAQAKAYQVKQFLKIIEVLKE